MALDPSTLTAFLIAGGALGTTAVTLYQARSRNAATRTLTFKQQSDSESILVETAMALLKPLQERITTLEAQNHELSNRLAKIEAGVRD